MQELTLTLPPQRRQLHAYLVFQVNTHCPAPYRVFSRRQLALSVRTHYFLPLAYLVVWEQGQTMRLPLRRLLAVHVTQVSTYI